MKRSGLWKRWDKLKRVDEKAYIALVNFALLDGFGLGISFSLLVAILVLN